MEIILIDSNKLKLILDGKEMKKYGLDSATASFFRKDSEPIHSLLCDIKKRCGFNTDGYSVFIELFESAHGGCEIFITREDIDSLHSNSLDKSLNGSIVTYKFNTADDVISASKILTLKNFDCKSRLFCDEHGLFYLSLTFMNVKDSYSGTIMFLNEFGERAKSQYLREYLGEHGRLICAENAIETLAKI